jgi:putative tricarboxylic transport membrane protein
MKLDDTVWGALFALLGAAILWHVQGFPEMPGQKVGPAMFPGLVAAALVVCGAFLVFRGVSARRRADGPMRWAEAPAWLRSRPQLLAFAVLVAANVFYLVVVDRLGFLITAFVYLTALMWVLRVRPALALAIALVMTLLIHYAFYKLLRVPLPWGVLTPIAW